MNRRQADIFVGSLVGAVLVVGAALAWQASQRQQAFGGMDGMMDGSMGTMHGTNPLWYVLGTLLLAGVVGGLYLVVRDDLGTTGATPAAATAADPPAATAAEPSDDAASSDDVASSDTTEPADDATHSDAGDASESPASVGESGGPPGGVGAAVNPASQSRSRVLDLLPEDERRILEPVMASPGITQIALRDRADFSKSKVSQTVSDLEKRGLLYRERQGRTYRVYPSDDLTERGDG